MRKATRLFLTLASVLLLAVAMSATASADPNGPGNNGTVKIVNNGDDPITADDRDNDPHVCSFHIYGFHFDDGSSGTWRIDRWAPTGSGTAATGTWQADGTGQFHVPGPALADGHYKLFVKQTSPSTPGGDKQKVFWVRCPATQGAPGTQGSQAGQQPSPSATAAPTTTSPAATGGVAGNGSAATPTPTQLGVQQNNSLPGGSTQTNTGPMTGQGGPALAPSGTNGTNVAGVETLPSTSTGSAGGLAALGVLFMAGGALLLRRRPFGVRS